MQLLSDSINERTGCDNVIQENLHKYSQMILMFYLAVALLGVGGFFLTENTLGDTTAGKSIIQITTSIGSITTALSNADSVIDYGLLVGYALYHGINIIIQFLNLVLHAVEPIAVLLHIPASVYGPIQIVINCIIIYDFGKLILNR